MQSLEERQIPAQHFLHELLINLLVRSGQYYQLHQLLQYHIISDSKPLACLLLSLEAAYPAAFQLSMDMLSRLKTSQEEIVEILLSKKKSHFCPYVCKIKWFRTVHSGQEIFASSQRSK